MNWTEGLTYRVELHIAPDGRTESHVYVTDATYAQAAQAIQGAAKTTLVPLVLIFDGDMTEVKRYTQQYGVAMLE